jgi:hypothetical protein
MEALKTTGLALAAAALIALLWVTAGPSTAITVGIVFVIVVGIVATVTIRRAKPRGVEGENQPAGRPRTDQRE